MPFDLDDLLDCFNWISRLDAPLRGLLIFLPARDLRGHWRIAGGWAEIHTERYDDQGVIAHTGGDAERLLKKHGIPIWSRRVRQLE